MLFQLIPVISLGFLLGIRHACDPDHVIAISTVVARHRKVGVAARVGAMWGIGHSATIILIGMAIIGLSITIPAWIASSLELPVGLMLIVLGVINLSGLARRLSHRVPFNDEKDGSLLHSHTHHHDGLTHSHPHMHLLSGHHPMPLRSNSTGAFLIGMVHGLAGSAAIALLVMTTIRNQLWAVIYLLIFSVGTIAGMMLISIGMALPFSMWDLSSAKTDRMLTVGSGALSFCFGLAIVARVVL